MHFTKIRHFIKKHRVWSGVIAIAVLGGAYYTYGKITSTAGETSYIVGNVRVGSIISTITGTGQISASSQIDIKSKASGDLVYLNTQANGQQVKKGTLIAQVDTRDAALSLENARIAYAKLVKPADASTLLQTQKSLSDALQSNAKAYNDAFGTITSTLVDVPNIMSGLNTMLYTTSGYLDEGNARSMGQSAIDYRTKAGVSYDKAKNQYDSLLLQYKNISRTDATSTIESFVSDTYALAKNISEAVKDAQNAVQFMETQRDNAAGTTAASSISSWTSTINSDVASLLSIRDTIISSRQDVDQKNEALVKLQSGPDSLDIDSQRINLRQAENTYADYFIRAPFDGVLARLAVRSTDSVSGGTVIGTIVSAQKVADITLNEVDAAQVHVGQKATLTFDAISGATLDGTVISVDLVGTVTQGVVNYNAQVAVDTDDVRIRSGMSVTAAIIVNSKENVLTVPNSAVKAQGNNHYVEMFTPPLVVTRGQAGTLSKIAPKRVPVETGVSDDTKTEIISGIKEGDQIVIRTVAGTAAPKTTTPTIFGAATGNTRTGTGGTGGVRIPRN